MILYVLIMIESVQINILIHTGKNIMISYKKGLNKQMAYILIQNCHILQENRYIFRTIIKLANNPLQHRLLNINLLIISL